MHAEPICNRIHGDPPCNSWFSDEDAKNVRDPSDGHRLFRGVGEDSCEQFLVAIGETVEDYSLLSARIELLQHPYWAALVHLRDLNRHNTPMYSSWRFSCPSGYPVPPPLI